MKLCEALQRDKKGNRGVKILKTPDQNGYQSVSKLQCPNVLIEPFFGSNANDCELAILRKEPMVKAIREALDIWTKWDNDGSE
jgi:hypothetical protein